MNIVCASLQALGIHSHDGSEEGEIHEGLFFYRVIVLYI